MERKQLGGHFFRAGHGSDLGNNIYIDKSASG